MVFTLGPPLSVILQCVVAAMAGAVMGTRLWLRKHRGQPFDISDYVTMLCIFSLLVTTTMVSVVGQFNVSGVLKKPGGPTPHDLAIARRITHVFWGQKAVVLLFIQRVWGGLPWPRIWILVAWGWLTLTFAFAVVGWSVSCVGPVHNILLTGHPPGLDPNNEFERSALFQRQRIIILLCCAKHLQRRDPHHTPDPLGSPGPPTLAPVRSLSPYPTLSPQSDPEYRRLLLIGLFSIGILVAAASLSRAFFTTTNPSINIIITLFEVLLSALAANLPTMYTLRRRKPRAPSDPECRMPPHPSRHRPRPPVLTDTQIMADSTETDTDTQSERRTRVSSQASTEPLVRRELYT
ncbi:uncharacterized protein BO95DRAFT_437380 [Aspergillus brunneoviolaceus CBS 621.78]|uniref:Uncharacterized protein n=1 Tax=Aspergillus brunneoviolaceus CBS 621.78 TaxID=1450534 RepID=A0ACD1FRR4_9EURO|nr:hypothetical protein BO95DRAFT_437380 [Aspergillus brunneoviolaceus CBS 621.78]RAH39674.1 hypothetical protein BO95DRAFT_437380 [Aspergillus brunneoviolaceus CBS 621.78]